MKVLERLEKAPYWALLSLAMNCLLLMAVSLTWEGDRTAKVPTPKSSVLPQANASVATEAAPEATNGLVTAVGDREYFTYQQWVDLVRQEAQAHADASRLTVLLGDSISLWFPQELLPGRRTWLNQGISGEKSDMLLRRLDALDGTQPDTIFVMVGINDLIAQVPEKSVAQNLEQSVQYLKQQHPEARIIVQSILPHGAERATWEGRDQLLQLPNDRIQAVNTAIANMADAEGVEYLNLYPLFADGEGALRPDLTTDGLHLSDRGYLVWRTAIALMLNDERDR
ncbi:GDSL-type esterase/lipase family protein [Halomicronema sp. CCY15110]|uniref:GDSL-type esterase/lipase family protein n=1 Tax=Halomicronema sp. CCY15110 TaxID=2767773 RepID=UPI001EF19E1E|nr:GDSL-type esterase/lipase family protein [Halomicronema sp. CCY15110]